MIATQVEGGWQLDGDVPLVSGWGRIDALLVNGRTLDDQRVVSALVPAVADASLSVEPLRLLAANASGTVRARMRGIFVPAARVVNVEPYRPPPPYDGGGRYTASLPLGVTRRCLRLMGPSGLDAELNAARQALDDATEQTMAEARAAAGELALRSAGALVVAQGSSSLLPSSHAQRLLREAVFLQVFASRPAICRALLSRLNAGTARA